MHRNRPGPLLACWASPVDQVRARGGHWQPRGASAFCCTSRTEASAQDTDTTFPNQGGSQLARPPAEITIADVVGCLEGEAAARAAASRDTPEFDVLSALQERLDQARAEILLGTSLQDLLEQRDQRAQAQAMYFI